MVGQILGTPGTLPPVFRQIEIRTHLLPRLLGVAADENKKKVFPDQLYFFDSLIL